MAALKYTKVSFTSKATKAKNSIIFFLTNYLFLIPLLYYKRVLTGISRIKLKVKES